MKLKFDMSDNYFELFDEVQGLLLFNKKIRDGKKTKIRKFSSYLKLSLGIYFLLYLLIVILMVLLNASQNISDIMTFILAILGGILLFVITSYYVWFNSKGEIVDKLVIKKTGIEYEEEMYKWDDVLDVIITKNVVLFKLAKMRKYFFVPNDLNKEFLKELKKYKVTNIYEIGD